MSDTFAVQIDGHTFLSQDEVDAYYRMLAEQWQAEGVSEWAARPRSS
ncbi:hypothetical protein [Streptomyces montanus]|nr:hypothetical protein [Streptomyces montanus]